MAHVMRIVFCVLACLFVAAAIPIGAIFGWIWFLALAAAAALFGCLMFLCKRKSDPAPPAPDFMNSDEENERIRRIRKEHKSDGSDR